MNVKYINPLLESALNVLSTMAMTEATMGRPRLKNSTAAMGDVTGVIDLTGPQARGSLAISFPEPVILAIGSKMLGETLNEIDSSVVDMVGEITNMITGGAKALYAEQGLEFELTLPHMQVGKDDPVEHTTDGETILLPFSTEDGEFFVELNFA